MEQKVSRKNGNGGNLGFEAELFKAAGKLRGKMEPSDYSTSRSGSSSLSTSPMPSRPSTRRS